MNTLNLFNKLLITFLIKTYVITFIQKAKKPLPRQPESKQQWLSEACV
ncbi:hypothetical protein [Nostoc sp.]